MTPRFRLRCWGVRGTAPAPGPHTVRYGGHTMCAELSTADGRTLFLDAGSGLAPALRVHGDAGADVLLSHLHLDHLLGAPALFDARERSTVHTAADLGATRQALRALLSPPLYPAIGDIDAAFRVAPIDAHVPVAIGDHALVHRFPARHPGGAAIFRVDDAAGPAIAFAPDNELDYASSDDDVIAWRRGLVLALRGVPVLLHDATWADAEVSTRRGWGHSSALEATRFAIECDAGMLLLVHHHPARDDDAIESIVAACREHVRLSGHALRVLGAWEGLTLTV